MKVGCQLIVFGAKMKEAPEEVLSAIAAAGYDGIETGEPAAWTRVTQLKKLLHQHDLRYVGAHTGFERMESIQEVIDQVLELDGRYVICSGVPDRESLAGFEAAARVFNDVAKEVARSGLTFAYHNHSWEFKTFDGVAGIDRLYELTDPRRVKFCVDTYWVHDGGRVPEDFIREHVDRIAFLHLKDRKDNTYAEVGQGELNWHAIMREAGQGGIQWVVTEQDETRRTPAESVAISRTYLKETFGV